jgi:hypothetical protein
MALLVAIAAMFNGLLNSILTVGRASATLEEGGGGINGGSDNGGRGEDDPDPEPDPEPKPEPEPEPDPDPDPDAQVNSWTGNTH